MSMYRAFLDYMINDEGYKIIPVAIVIMGSAVLYVGVIERLVLAVSA